MMNKKFLYYLLFFLLFGCASNKDTRFELNKQEGLLEKFDIKDEEFKKFQEVSEVTEVDLSNDVIKVVDAPEKKEVKKTKVIKKEEKVVVKKIEKKSIESSKKDGDQYPADYPEELKTLDKKSRLIWEKFIPRVFPGEEALFSVKYLGITAGHLKLITNSIKKINDQFAYHFTAQLKTASFYSYIYTLEDSVETFVNKDFFRPVKFTLIQRESAQSVDDLQLFDYKTFKTFHWYRKEKKGVKKDEKKSEFIPRYAQDSFSVLHFLRGLPFQVGSTFNFPVITRAKYWILKVQVEKIETIRVNERLYSAFKINAETHYPGVLKKSGDISFWFSNDERRIPLKFSAKIKIGSVEGELVNYKD